jgi:hypothetical protein
METQTYEPQRSLTFDDVWAALMEDRKRQEETDRQLKEYITTTSVGITAR